MYVCTSSYLLDLTIFLRPRGTVRGCRYFYLGPESTRKQLYSLAWNHIVGKTKSLHDIVLVPHTQKTENGRAVPAEYTIYSTY